MMPAMTKITFWALEKSHTPSDYHDFLLRHGRRVGRGFDHPYIQSGDTFLDITAPEGDERNGLGDEAHYRRIIDEIDKKTARYLSANWSRTKIDRWKADIEKQKLDPLLKKARDWIDLFQLAREELKLIRIRVVISVSSQEKSYSFRQIESLDLTTVSPLEVLQLKEDIIYSFS